jgi:hypothetical protein
LPDTAWYDIWGLSRNILLYVEPGALPILTSSYAIITRRSNVQKVVSTAMNYLQNPAFQYAIEGRFPFNAPAEIRVTGLDNARAVRGGKSPSLSAIHYVDDHPEFDTAVLDRVRLSTNTIRGRGLYRARGVLVQHVQ